MVTELNDLRAAVSEFLAEAAARSRSDIDRSDPALLPDVWDFAQDLADLATCKAANAVAETAALANSYAVREEGPSDARGRVAGRRLDAHTLRDTGIAELLLREPSADVDLIAAGLAEYLAGPPIPIYRYAIIDADIELASPVPVVDGWELVTPSREELELLSAFPAAVPSYSRWQPDMYDRLAMLRRVDADQRPIVGFVFSFNEFPAHELWEPLLALSLFQNDVVHLWASYIVEPGRRVDQLFDEVGYQTVSYDDGETTTDIPGRGSYTVDLAQSEQFTRFLARVGPLIEQARTASKATKAAGTRLRRATEHFLLAGEHAHYDGNVVRERNSQTVLHYVVALEGLLAGADGNAPELSRRVAQRAAILAGVNDADRLAVHDTVREAYGARSRYAHGGEAPEIDLPGLRSVVRRCLLARLILGDPTSDRELHRVADEALLSQGRLLAVRALIDEFPPS